MISECQRLVASGNGQLVRCCVFIHFKPIRTHRSIGCEDTRDQLLLYGHTAESRLQRLQKPAKIMSSLGNDVGRLIGTLNYRNSTAWSKYAAALTGHVTGQKQTV